MAAESLRVLWPEIMDVYLDNEQLTFLQACVGLCEERHPDVALLRYVTSQQVTRALGWAEPDFNLVLDIARKLEEAGLLDKRGGLGPRIDRRARLTLPIARSASPSSLVDMGVMARSSQLGVAEQTPSAA